MGEDHRLLLLPPPPSDVTSATLRAAYGPALTSILAEPPSATFQVTRHLDLAVQTEHADDGPSRASVFDYHQRLLAGLYRLIAILTAEKGLELDQGSSSDERIFFVVRSPAVRAGASVADQSASKGPIIPLETLALSNRSWSVVYAMEGEQGEGLLQDFTTRRKSARAINTLPTFEVRRIAGGTSVKTTQGDMPTQHGRQHSSIAVGGTFDHLHLGHRLLLTMTAFLADPSGTPAARARSITVGITGDELLKNKKYAEVLESWDERQSAAYRFLAGVISFDAKKEPKVRRINEEGPNGKAVHYTFDDDLTIKCVEISDPFGPTITDESISALVVSGETRAGGQAVNTKRGEKQWAPLDVFEVGVLDTGASEESASAGTEAFESKISSTEIRRRLCEKAAASR